jgi:hypothetical protein
VLLAPEQDDVAYSKVAHIGLGVNCPRRSISRSSILACRYCQDAARSSPSSKYANTFPYCPATHHAPDPVRRDMENRMAGAIVLLFIV